VSKARPLLEGVAGLLERTYRLRSGLAEVGPFVIGDEGYRNLYRRRREQVAAGSADEEAKLLMRETDVGVLACIYFPDAMIRRLEAFPPQRGVGEENLDAFAAFVEEIDHLLVVAECARLGRSVSLFELELHANVSKYLVLSRFLAGRADRLHAAARIWLRRRLCDHDRVMEKDPASRGRYREAARWAVKLLERMPALRAAERIATLRRFHAKDVAGKLELIGRLAA
jgi:hypothetical protein